MFCTCRFVVVYGKSKEKIGQKIKGEKILLPM